MVIVTFPVTGNQNKLITRTRHANERTWRRNWSSGTQYIRSIIDKLLQRS